MIYQSHDLMIYRPVLGLDQWVSLFHLHQINLRILRLYIGYGLVTGLNPDVALAQAMVETGYFTSVAWKQRYNPCGLGITGPGVEGPTFLTQRLGIQAHYAHLCCYFFGAPACPACELGWKEPRHNFHAGYMQIGDLARAGNQYRWATDLQYVDKILTILYKVAAL